MIIIILTNKPEVSGAKIKPCIYQLIVPILSLLIKLQYT